VRWRLWVRLRRLPALDLNLWLVLHLRRWIGIRLWELTQRLLVLLRLLYLMCVLQLLRFLLLLLVLLLGWRWRWLLLLLLR